MTDETIALENKFKVSLRTVRSQPYQTLAKSQRRTGREVVVFDVTPEITEARNVEYKSMQPIHMPGQIYAYGSTSSRTFSLSGIKLISRTIEEADENMNRLWVLRSWTMPYFGDRSSTLSETEVNRRRSFEGIPPPQRDTPQRRREFFGSELLGKPPEVLLFSAYSDVRGGDAEQGNEFNRSIQTNIDNIPVVMQSLSIPYPADVDYIPTTYGQPFPRVMILDIQLLETRAPREFTKNFSLKDFREGTLRGF